eukprot:XP_002511725.2 uncharacterized protein LOC8270643 [Ricinus communis]
MKTGKVPTFVKYIFPSLSFPLLILFSSSLSSSSSSSSVFDKHDKFLVSTYDLMVVMRKSSGVSLFFMLSFIIITISLGSGSNSSPTPRTAGDHLDGFFPYSSLVYEMNNMIIKKEEQLDQDHLLKYYDDSSSSSGDDYEEDDGYEQDNEDDIGIDIEELYNSEGENDDKDLDRRIEEFIAKVNQKWREEWITDRLLCLPAAY